MESEDGGTPGRSLADGQEGAGGVNRVRRFGDAVHRPAGPWTPAVHALLRHLEAAAFAGAPRALGRVGVDPERVSYLEGEVALRPWPAALRGRDGMDQLGRFLRRLHQAQRDFVPPEGARWRVEGARWRPGWVVCHGDLGPWNTVWRGGALVGLIDWDFAEPGPPLHDLAQLAWNAVPLRPDEACRAAGVEPGPEQGARLEVLVCAYGAEVEPVLDLVEALQARSARRIRELGGRGEQPWADFLARGFLDEVRAEAAWLARFRRRRGSA